MKTKLAILAALIASAFLGHGCAVGPAADRSPHEAIGSSGSPIEGGNAINNSADPASSWFPQSTVRLRTTGIPLPDGGTRSGGCTGVIVAPTKILTAAHCKPNNTTVVEFYQTTPGTGDLPTGFTMNASSTHKIDVPPGVICDNDVDGGVPDTCYSCDGGVGCSASNGYYADLAVVTLSAPVPAPYQMTTLGPTGQFAASSGKTLWEVGTGMMDLKKNGWDASPSANRAHEMKWVPITLSTLDAGDGFGFFLSNQLYGNPGDSGGPVYQYAAASGADAGSYNLVLVGITSAANSVSNMYTSVEYPPNYTWIEAYGGALSGPEIATFGAAIVP